MELPRLFKCFFILFIYFTNQYFANNCTDGNQGCITCHSTVECAICNNSSGYIKYQEYCRICTSNCSSCLNPPCADCSIYQPILNGIQCQRCQDPNCANCQFNQTQCIVCESGYGVHLQSCELCQSNPNCETCSAENLMLCQQCKIGYGLIQIDQEIKCSDCMDSHCKVCSNFSICEQCQPGFFQQSNQCFNCISNCQICPDNTICHTCFDNYYLDQTKTICTQCPLLCTLCMLNPTYLLPQCTQCQTGLYQFNNDSPKTCREYCGDEYTTTLDCDNIKGLALDGCDDDCDVMVDFECQVSNGSTYCYYQQLMIIKFVSMNRQKFQNKIYLTLSIQPSLNTFQSFPQPLFIQMFRIINTTILSIKYNNQTSQLHFQILLQAHFKTPFIDLQFHNRKNKSLSLQTYNIPLNTQYIDVLRYTQFSFKIGKVIMVFSIFVTVLGWIAFGSGLIMKRLAGLEAMIFLQLAWISIFQTNNYLSLPIYSAMPLKFSSLYSISLPPIEPPSIKSFESPHFLQFLVSPSAFSNNFNIPVVILFICLIVLKVTHHKLRKQKEILKSQQVDEEDTQIILETQILNYGRSVEILMSSVMLFLAYFIQCGVLFFQKGSIAHVASYFVLLITLAIYVFTFCLFFIDPVSFGYFRLHFQLNFWGINHYCILVLTIISTVLLMNLLASFSFLSSLPSFLLLVYTLYSKPYKNFTENLRSAFNLVVMINLMIQKYLIQINVEQKRTEMMLLANVILLAVVAIWAIVSNGYFYWQQKKQKQMQQYEAYEKENKNYFRVLKNISALSISSVNINCSHHDNKQKRKANKRQMSKWKREDNYIIENGKNGSINTQLKKYIKQTKIKRPQKLFQMQKLQKPEHPRMAQYKKFKQQHYLNNKSLQQTRSMSTKNNYEYGPQFIKNEELSLPYQIRERQKSKVDIEDLVRKTVEQQHNYLHMESAINHNIKQIQNKMHANEDQKEKRKNYIQFYEGI